MNNNATITAAPHKTWTRLFIGFLALQAVLEFGIGATLLFSFSTALETGFGITYSEELDILGLALGLYLLLLTTLMVLSLVWTNRANYAGITLGIIIGIFLFTFGMASFLKFGGSQALIIDGLRGALTIIFAYMAGKELKSSNQ